MKVREAIELINNSNILYCISDAETLLEGETLLENGLYVDSHRWYDVSDSYYQLEDGILGIRGISNIYSEWMSASDCHIPVSAFEGEEVTVVSYKSKSNG